MSVDRGDFAEDFIETNGIDVAAPTAPLSGGKDFLGNMGGGFLGGMGGAGGIPPITATSGAESSSSAQTRIGFSTGGFSGGSGMNIKNMLIVGGICVVSLFVYMRFR